MLSPSMAVRHRWPRPYSPCPLSLVTTRIGRLNGTSPGPCCACCIWLNISVRTKSTNPCICRFISSIRSRICSTIAMPAMFTPRSRARFKMNSSLSRSSSVYSRVFPSDRDGRSKPSRSYMRSVCGWMSYISATAEIMYAPRDLRFVAIASSIAQTALHSPQSSQVASNPT